MEYTYAILGAGMQGTAAAYDLARFGSAHSILLGDARLEQAEKSAHRVNALVGRSVCQPFVVDAMNPMALGGWISQAKVLLSCVPFWMHPQIARVAIANGVSMCDLGGNTEVTMETLAMDADAKAAGVSLVPDTGLAPGLVNSLGLWLIEHLDSTETVRLYCGVLPQDPQPPYNYKLTFNVEGLVTEYDHQAVVLRDGQIRMIDTLAELETIRIEELGEMEAFTTSGGTSTAPYTFQGRVRNYEYKTIRFPGHCAFMRAFRDGGFWSDEPIVVDGGSVVPRKAFCRIFDKTLRKFGGLDQCAIRGLAIGTKDGTRKELMIDVFDRQCEATGFTSMERLTGFSIAIHAIEIAKGALAPGALRYETALTGSFFVSEIQKRGIGLKFSEIPLDRS